MLETSVDAQIEYRDHTFRLKQAYPVENIEQLKTHLLDRCKDGISGDENFEMCYKGIQDDIEKLIADGWVRVVNTQAGTRKTAGNQIKIYFPRDLRLTGDKQVEWDETELPQNCQEYLAKEFKDIAENETKKAWDKVLESNPTLLCE